MTSRLSSPPAPLLAIELVRWSDLAWLPVGLVLLILGGLAIALRSQITGIDTGVIGVLLIVIGLIAGGIGVWWVWKALHGRTVQFGDDVRLTPLIRSVIRIPWSDVAEVTFHRAETEYQQVDTEGIWLVPIPGVGSLTITQVSTKTRWWVQRYVELHGHDGRPIVRIERGLTDELRFSLWYERHQLQQAIRSLNGSLDWDQRGLTRVSLSGTSITDDVFVPLRQRLVRVRELRELDISATKLTGVALECLDQCESLAVVNAAGAQIPKVDLDRLHQVFANRQAQAGFGFLRAAS